MLKLNLGCSDRHLPGYVNVDRSEPADQIVDLRLTWPWADNSVDEIIAWDCIEHLPDPIHTMNELYRVLRDGGMVDIIVPTTEGRGAWQDPTHVSWWNRNSFFYYEASNPHLTRFREDKGNGRDGNGVRCSFRIIGESTENLPDHVVKLRIQLQAVKGPVEKPVETVEIKPEATKVKAGDFAFSILHTSARPNEWRKVYDAWLAAAVNPEQVEYILCIDERWGFAADDVILSHRQPLRPQDRVIWNTGRRCYVDGVNLAAQASSGAILIVNADDQYPCEKWDEKVLNILYETGNDDRMGLPDSIGGDFVISVSTNTPQEHERHIMVMPILSRERYERFGWVFYPEYESMYADNDFAAMAKRDGCIIDARHLVFPHKHWINGQRSQDEQDRAQNSKQAYDEGAKLFAARRRINFSGIPPKVAEAAPEGVNTKLPMVAFCTPGNVFSAAWVDAWTRLWGHAVGSGKYNVTHLLQYTSNAGMVRQSMAHTVLTTDYGVPIDFVLWIDDDNALTVEQFEMLMQDLRDHPEYDAVAGWTWCGTDDQPEVGTATTSCGFVKMLERTPDGKDLKFCRIKQITVKEMVESPTDLIEIQYSGFPVVLMRAELLRKAGKQPFTPFVDERCEYGFSGEDLAFFVRANIRSGARYAMDRRVYVPHYKRRAIEPRLTPEQMTQAQGREMAMK